MTEPRTAPRRRSGSLGEALAGLRRIAAAGPERFADLSTASPVDPSPAFVADVLGHEAPGYPPVAGTPTVRSAIVDWFDRVRGVPGLRPADTLVTMGSKEFIGLLPLALGIGPGDVVVHPELAYPAYANGALEVGARALGADDPAAWPRATRLVWLNSPRNPDGRVLSTAELRAAVARARALGAVIVADECYAVTNAAPGERVPSILVPEVVGDDRGGVLVSYSVSKQSNLAGHRLGLVAGDPVLVERVLAMRRRLGLIMPAPSQRVLAAVLAEPRHVAAQRERYRRRRGRLRAALAAAGFRVDGPDAGLYVWATRGQDGWDTATRLAGAGVLVTPGEIFGPGGAAHIRCSVTVSDADLDRAVGRLAAA